MPIIKAGIVVNEDGSDSEGAWHFDPGTTVDVIIKDDILILRIQADDLLAVADAVRGMQLRQIQDERESRDKDSKGHRPY